MRTLGIGLGLILLLLGCDQREIAAPRTDWGYDYYPLAIGRSWTYAMDSITLRPAVGGAVFDSVRLVARETLVDTLRDAAGQLWYRGERYDRRVDSTDFRFAQTFLLRRDDRRALRREDNLEFVKLVFPPRSGADWDGHVAFDETRELIIGGESFPMYAGWDYRIIAADEPFAGPALTFDSAVVIRQAEEDGLLDFRAAHEVYARGVGLVYREITAFATQCTECCSGNTALCLDLPWRAKAERGLIIRQWLTDYGE